MARKKMNSVNEAARENLAVSSAKKSGDNVVVALNYPTGVTFNVGTRRVTLNGNAEKLRGKGQGHLPVGAFGLTVVARDDWEYIKKTYGKMRLFKNGLLFAAENKAAAIDEADEKEDTRHGLEPVEPKQPGISEAETAEG